MDGAVREEAHHLVIVTWAAAGCPKQTDHGCQPRTAGNVEHVVCARTRATTIRMMPASLVPPTGEVECFGQIGSRMTSTPM